MTEQWMSYGWTVQFIPASPMLTVSHWHKKYWTRSFSASQLFPCWQKFSAFSRQPKLTQPPKRWQIQTAGSSWGCSVSAGCRQDLLQKNSHCIFFISSFYEQCQNVIISTSLPFGRNSTRDILFQVVFIGSLKWVLITLHYLETKNPIQGKAERQMV